MMTRNTFRYIPASERRERNMKVIRSRTPIAEPQLISEQKELTDWVEKYPNNQAVVSAPQDIHQNFLHYTEDMSKSGWKELTRDYNLTISLVRQRDNTDLRTWETVIMLTVHPNRFVMTSGRTVKDLALSLSQQRDLQRKLDRQKRTQEELEEKVKREREQYSNAPLISELVDTIAKREDILYVGATPFTKEGMHIPESVIESHLAEINKNTSLIVTYVPILIQTTEGVMITSPIMVQFSSTDPFYHGLESYTRWQNLHPHVGMGAVGARHGTFCLGNATATINAVTNARNPLALVDMIGKYLTGYSRTGQYDSKWTVKSWELLRRVHAGLITIPGWDGVTFRSTRGKYESITDTLKASVEEIIHVSLTRNVIGSGEVRNSIPSKVDDWELECRGCAGVARKCNCHKSYCISCSLPDEDCYCEVEEGKTPKLGERVFVSSLDSRGVGVNKTGFYRRLENPYRGWDRTCLSCGVKPKGYKIKEKLFSDSEEKVIPIRNTEFTYAVRMVVPGDDVDLYFRNSGVRSGGVGHCSSCFPYDERAFLYADHVEEEKVLREEYNKRERANRDDLRKRMGKSSSTSTTTI